MRIETLAAAAVLSLAATIPLSTAAFAEPRNSGCFTEGVKAEFNGRHCSPDVDPADHQKPNDHHKPWVNPCRGLVHGIIEDETLHEVTDKVQERLKDGKPCRDDEREHKRRSHDDPDEKTSSHHKKSDDSDSDDDQSSGSDDGDGKSDDDSDDDTTSTQIKVVPKGSVDTGDGSSL